MNMEGNEQNAVMNKKRFHDAVKEKIGDFERVETHLSEIYLGKETVVKVQKPADFWFVDMRPIEKRKGLFVKSSEIDEAYCPDLNTHVATVISSPKGARIVDGLADESILEKEERIADYALVMRRFDSSQELSKLYKRGQVTEEHARQIGNLFADGHKRAKTGEKISDIGFRAITGNFDECFAITENFVGKSIAKEDYDAIKSCYRKFVDTNRKYLEKRRDSGFIRQCHGDAHSGNMFVEDGIVKIFDGMGLKDEFSCMDTAVDFAFVYMDAIAHGRGDLAEIMKGAYVEKTKDAEGVEKLLDFYVSYRAFIRGQVTTMNALGFKEEARKKDGKSANRKESESKMHGLLLTAGRYFRMSKNYALKSMEVTHKNN